MMLDLCVHIIQLLSHLISLMHVIELDICWEKQLIRRC